LLVWENLFETEVKRVPNLTYYNLFQLFLNDLWFIFFPWRLRHQMLRHIKIYARCLLQARLSIFLINCLDVAVLTNSSFKPHNMYLSLSNYK